MLQKPRKKARAMLSADGKTFTLFKRTHKTVRPISDLDSHIRFYEGLRDRVGGKYADTYAENCEALYGLKKKIEANG